MAESRSLSRGNLRFSMFSMKTWVSGWRLTIKAIYHFHPLALALLDVLFLESILSLDKFGLPPFDTVLLAQAL
jgi:hypothetical protein